MSTCTRLYGDTCKAAEDGCCSSQNVASTGAIMLTISGMFNIHEEEDTWSNEEEDTNIYKEEDTWSFAEEDTCC